MNRYAVTGGAGSLGAGLVDRLLAEGHQVVLVDQEWPGNRTPDVQCRVLVGDLTTPAVACQALEGCDGVVHAGAIRHARWPLDGLAHRNNYLSSYNLLEAACHLQLPHIVIISSAQACGYFGDREPLTPTRLPLEERCECQPRNTYGLAKWFGEQLADFCATLLPQLSFITLRFPFIAPREWLQHHGSARNQSEAWQLGQMWRRELWTCIAWLDAVEACWRALQVDGHRGHTVLFPHSPQPLAGVGWQQLRETFFPELAWPEALPPDSPIVRLDQTPALLGWQPRPWREWLDTDPEGRIP